MVAKNLDGIVPEPGEFTADDLALLAAADGLLDRVRGHYDATAMHLALEAIWSVLGAANKYFSAQEPWVLRKIRFARDPARFRTVLYTTLETVRIATLLSQPVMPESTGKLLDLLGQPDDQRTFAAIGTRLAPGTRAACAGRGVPALSGGVKPARPLTESVMTSSHRARPK